MNVLNNLLMFYLSEVYLNLISTETATVLNIRKFCSRNRMDVYLQELTPASLPIIFSVHRIL